MLVEAWQLEGHCHEDGGCPEHLPWCSWDGRTSQTSRGAFSTQVLDDREKDVPAPLPEQRFSSGV